MKKTKDDKCTRTFMGNFPFKKIGHTARYSTMMSYLASTPELAASSSG